MLDVVVGIEGTIFSWGILSEFNSNNSDFNFSILVKFSSREF
jgi:hypothetical protein